MFRKSLSFRRNLLGLVSEPSHGKSTLFNAVTQATGSGLAATAVHQFTTLTEQRKKVDVVDKRLIELASFAKSGKIHPVDFEISDVPGLIAGAAKGEGMGNQFLSSLRPAAVLAHVVRCFDGEGFDPANPAENIAIISQELILADLQSVEKRAQKVKGAKKAKAAPGAEFDESAFTAEVQQWLEEGSSARDLPAVQPLPPLAPGQAADEKRRRAQRAVDAKRASLESMQLFSNKPIIYVCNVDDDSIATGNAHSRKVEEIVGKERSIRVCALLEEQLAGLGSREEKLEMLKEYGVEEPASEELARRVFDMLGMQTFFTVGPLMAKAWSFPKRNSSAKEVAGLIHGDFSKHFRSARVQQWDTFIQGGSLKGAEQKMMQVGAGHEIQDGDVFIVEHDAKK